MLRTLCLLFVSACLAFPAVAGTKRAFIVGVGDYAELPDLQKTTGDANGYARVFESDLGFEVTRLIDPDTDRFLEAFDGFLQSIEPGDQVAFIFSGHGWSDGSSSFLALSDAPFHTSEFALRKRTISLGDEVLGELRARNPEIVFAIIDACRDNPFDLGTRTITRGIIRVPEAPGVLVVYAAGELEKALDRLGPEDDAPYSVFTREMLPKLADPDVALVSAVDEAREAVVASAATVGHAQNPAVTSNIGRKFCFSGNCRRGGMSQEEQDWLYLTSVGYTAVDICEKYRRHLAAYPDGIFAETARTNLSNPPCAAARLKLQEVKWYADLTSHTDEVSSVDFSPSGRFLATASLDGTAHLWAVGRAPSELGDLTLFWRHEAGVLSVRFSPDEERVVTASMDGTARIWGAASGNELRRLEGHDGTVSYADYSTDGRRIATAGYDHTVRIWDAGTGRELKKITGHTAEVRSVRYSPDGAQLLTASNDGTVRLWDAETGELLRVVESAAMPAAYAEFSPDGEKILVATGDLKVRIWGASGEPVVLDENDKPLWNAAFSPDGEMVATAADGLPGRLWDARNGASLARMQTIGAATNWVDFSPDGKLIALAVQGGKAQLWEMVFGPETPGAP